MTMTLTSETPTTRNHQVLKYNFFAYAMDIFLIFPKHTHLSEAGATHSTTITSHSFY